MVIALAGAGLRLATPSMLELLELKALDLRFRARPRMPDDALVIVGIDERNLARYGRWPGHGAASPSWSIA